MLRKIGLLKLLGMMGKLTILPWNQATWFFTRVIQFSTVVRLPSRVNFTLMYLYTLSHWNLMRNSNRAAQLKLQVIRMTYLFTFKKDRSKLNFGGKTILIFDEAKSILITSKKI